MSLLKVTWKKSYIGRNRRQRSVIHSLGLRRLGQTVVHWDSPTIRGMVNKVGHMLQIVEVDEPPPPTPQRSRRKGGPVA